MGLARSPFAVKVDPWIRPSRGLHLASALNLPSWTRIGSAKLEVVTMDYEIVATLVMAAVWTVSHVFSVRLFINCWVVVE